MTQVALRMTDAKESGDRATMLAAVRLNWQLWTIIQSDLLDPECPVPVELRSNGLSLANFIDKHTVEFLGNPAPEKLNILISINRELAGGLYQKPPGSQPAASEPNPPGPGQTDFDSTV